MSGDNIQSSNIFNLFPKYQLREQVNDVNKSTSPQKKESLDALELKSKKNKRRKILFGSTLASTILTVGLFSLLIAKGPHGSSFKKLSNISDNMADKLFESNENSSKKLLKKLVFYTRKATGKTVEVLESASNFTAIKDKFCNKIFSKTKFTKKFAEGSTSYFKGIVDKTLGKKYDKAEVKVKDMTSLLKHYNIKKLNGIDEAQKLQEVTIKGKTKTLGAWIEQLSDNTQRLETIFDKNFSLGARKMRDKKRQTLLKDVPEAIENKFFKDKKNLFNLKNYKGYVTEEVASGAQKELEKDIMSAKKQVTNNISAVHELIKNKINSMSQYIKPDDVESLNILDVIKQNLESFKTCSGINELSERQDISEIIKSNLENLKNVTSQNSIYSKKEKKLLESYLNSIKKTVNSTVNNQSKGSVEEIMTILKGLNQNFIKDTNKKIISDSEYKEFEKIAKQLAKNMEKATNLEAGEYFLKQAELKVGSAPTDVLSVLFPIGAGTFAIASSDDKDERISKTLTTCIPLVGTFATFVYGTTKMFSGAKNLLFTFVSGALLSKMGSYADELYKKYKKTGSITSFVKDEYNNLVTDITPKDFLNQTELKGK